MARRVRCPCAGHPDCQLCHGSKRYEYEPGLRGWMPFPCPTCHGSKDPACVTCHGAGTIDPAQPPSGGFIDFIFKFFLGA